MRNGVLPLAALVLVLTGCGAAREPTSGAESAEATVAAVDPSEVTTKIVGGTPEQQEVLREVLAGLGPTGLEEVLIKKSLRKPPAVGLVVPHEVENLMAEWHTWLLAQGFGERSRELGLPPVVFLAAERGDTDGEDAGPGPAAESTPTLSEALSTAARVRKAAELHGAEVMRLEILNPNGYAFLVELRVEGNQARFLVEGLPRVLGLVEPDESGFAGDYLLVVDGDGKHVWESVRAKDGDGWREMGGTARWDLAGCSPFFLGGPPGRGPPPCPVEPSDKSASSDSTTKIVGATPEQEKILRASLTGIGDERIASITVEEAESGWGASPGDVGLRVSPRRQAAHNMRFSWEAWLITHAFAVRSRELGLPTVAYMAYPGEASAIGEVTYDMAHRGTKARVDAFVRQVETESKRVGAQLYDIHVLRPLDYAVSATLQVSDPAEFLDRRAPQLFQRLGRPPGDFHLRFVDSKGDRIAESWHAASAGSTWVRPDLDGCSPYAVSRPTEYDPPPCPVD